MPKTAREVLLALSYHFDGDMFHMITAIRKKSVRVTDEDVLESMKKTKSMFVDICSGDFPDCFKTVDNPPLLLYYYGDLSLVSQPLRVTCVGTRNPNIYQSSTVYNLVKDAEAHFDNRLVVISGMAYGLDQAAMKAAMDVNAPVVAIIGSGIDNPYPTDNQGIYDYCKSGKGLILSEYPADLSAKPSNFIFRNRLLAAASDITFIGGGKKASGTNTTVRFALNMGKDVMALPCNITGDDLTNSIIADGAEVVLDSQSFIQYIEEANRKNNS